MISLPSQTLIRIKPTSSSSCTPMAPSEFLIPRLVIGSCVIFYYTNEQNQNIDKTPKQQNLKKKNPALQSDNTPAKPLLSRAIPSAFDCSSDISRTRAKRKRRRHREERDGETFPLTDERRGSSCRLCCLHFHIQTHAAPIPFRLASLNSAQTREPPAPIYNKIAPSPTDSCESGSGNRETERQQRRRTQAAEAEGV
jgi:hypothetical protein